MWVFIVGAFLSDWYRYCIIEIAHGTWVSTNLIINQATLSMSTL
ncbi:hypothetical protein [Weissella paramesenteroides]|nr:hypothetical protein [Weissella paramesenteroides]